MRACVAGRELVSNSTELPEFATPCTEDGVETLIIDRFLHGICVRHRELLRAAGADLRPYHPEEN